MNRKAFTLVEILIVVIILGILAAIVIPQFTEASNDARASALASDLQSVRAQIELYKMQHLGSLPGATIITQLTTPTSNLGATVAVGTAGALGPYLQKFPTNPFTSTNTVQIVTTLAGAPAGDGSTGWFFNTVTGAIGPNDADHVGM